MRAPAGQVKFEGDVLLVNTDGEHAFVRRMVIWFPLNVDLAQVMAFAVKVAASNLKRDDWRAVAVSVDGARFPVLDPEADVMNVWMGEEEDYASGKRLWELGDG